MLSHLKGMLLEQAMTSIILTFPTRSFRDKNYNHQEILVLKMLGASTQAK
jgi:hypothetical protein